MELLGCRNFENSYSLISGWEDWEEIQLLNTVSVYAEVTEEKVVISLVSKLIDMLSTEVHCRIQFYLKIVFVHASSWKGAFFHTSALL